MKGDLISRSALLAEINGEENKRADRLMREWYADIVERQPAIHACTVDSVGGEGRWKNQDGSNGSMERLTERTKDGQAIPKMDLKNNGHQRCMEKLAEYEELEEKGKLLKLPATIGDEVFFIYMDCPKDCKPEYCRDHEGSCENCHHRVPKIVRRDFRLSDIPRMDRFFATREEAEAALKETEEGQA